MDLSNYLNTKKLVKGSERNDILRQIYSFYDTGQEEYLRKKENWKRYIAFLKENRMPNTQENQTMFKKSKKFIKKMSPATLAYFLSHIPTRELYYILSVVKDRSFRNEGIGVYIMGLTKV